jgi:hypothetical protein
VRVCFRGEKERERRAKEKIEQQKKKIESKGNDIYIYISVKVYGPYSFSKDALREEGYTWLIKCLGHVSLSDNTSFHVWQLLTKHVFNIERERSMHHHPKNLALIPCKSLWALLTFKRRFERVEMSITYKMPRPCIS